MENTIKNLNMYSITKTASEIKKDFLKGRNSKVLILGDHEIKAEKTLTQKQGIFLAEVCNVLKLKGIDISNAKYADVISIKPEHTDIYDKKYREMENEVEVVFFCENYDIVVEMSKHAKITGLVCIGFPENLEWINNMRYLPKYLIFCEENCKCDKEYFMMHDFLNSCTLLYIGFLYIFSENFFAKLIP